MSKNIEANNESPLTNKAMDREAEINDKVLKCLEALVVAVKFQQKLAADKAAKKSRQSKI